LMYAVLPLWLAAGFADYLCHRASHIERTSGWKESVLHLVQFGEMAVPVLAALFLEINSGVILVMMAFLILHEATAIWDVRYASATREVSPTEQHVHSVLEMLPFTGLLLVIALHWPDFTALFGYGRPDFSFMLKQESVPVAYVVTMLTLTALLEVLPYLEELARGLHHHRQGPHQAGKRRFNDPGGTRSRRNVVVNNARLFQHELQCVEYTVTQGTGLRSRNGPSRSIPSIRQRAWNPVRVWELPRPPSDGGLMMAWALT
jgi:hypothetical protein